MGGKLLKAVKALQQAFAESNIMGMRTLSNELIEDAAIENDKMLASVALIGYSLHKLSTKEHVVEHGKWAILKRRVLASLEKAANALQRNNLQEFEGTLNGIIRDIRAIDAQTGNFVQGLYEKAMVKYAADAYSLGLSLSQATELTGAEKDRVLEYIGATRISDREVPELGIRERLKKLRKMM